MVVGGRRGGWWDPVECGMAWSGRSRSERPRIPPEPVDVVEVRGGCPWRYGGRDGKPWRSLLEAFSVCDEGGTHSEEDAVPAVVRDRGVGGGAGGSWRGFIDVVESSAEDSAGKLSLGPRQSGMVSTGWSAMSSELLEVGFCAVIPRGRRTSVDVRRRDRWVEDGNDVGVDSPGVLAVEPGRGSTVSCCWRVSHKIGKIRRNFVNGRHVTVSSIQGGTLRGASWKGSACPPPPAHTSNQPLKQGSQHLDEWFMSKVGRRGGWGGEEGRTGKLSRRLLEDSAREHLER